MATYYVDWDNGNDSNDGLSTSTPFKHAPRDDNASGLVPASLAAGDTVVFKGGVVYQGIATQNGQNVIWVGDNGASGNRITLISGHVHSSNWGTGRAVIDGASGSGGTYQRGIYVFGRAWITIEGFEIRNIGNKASPLSSTAGIIWENTGASDGEAINNVVHDINWFTDPGDSYALGWGIVSSRGDNLLVEHNTIYNVSDKGVSLFGGADDPNPDALNCIVRYNVIHDSAGHGIVMNTDSATIHGNIIWNTSTGAVTGSPDNGCAIKVDEGASNDIYNNIIYSCYCAMLVVVGRNNEFHHNTVYAVGEKGQVNTRFRAGIAMGDDGTSGWSAPVVTGNKFYNNSIHYCVDIDDADVNTRSQFISISGPTSAFTGGTSNEVKNNIFFGTTGDTPSTAARCVIYPSINWSGAKSFYSLSGWESEFATTWNGVASGNAAADQDHKGGSLASLANKPTGFLSDLTSPNDDGFELNENSPAIDNGTTVASPFDVDILGITRSNFTSGAYETGRTWFVDYASGSDTNDGKTRSTPWQHAPHDDAASGNVIANYLAGDTVYFKGGVVYTGTSTLDGARCIVVTSEDGSAGFPITLKSGNIHPTPWGGGRAVIDGEGTRIGVYVKAASHVTFEGLEIRNIGAPTSGADGLRFEAGAGSVDNGIVRNCVIHDVNWDPNTFIAADGILNSRGDNHLYENCEVYNVSDRAINIVSDGADPNTDALNCEVRYNFIHDIAQHGIQIQTDSAKVHGNILNDVGRGDSAITGASGATYAIKVDEGSSNQIYNNIVAQCARGIAVLIGRNNEIHHNLVYGTGIYGSTSSRGRGALVLAADHADGSWSSPYTTGNKFHNNSIHHVIDADDVAAGAKFIVTNGIAATGTSNEFKNNIFYGLSGDTTSSSNRCVIVADEIGFGGTRTGYSLSAWETEFNTTHNGDASGNLAGDQLFQGGVLAGLVNRPTGFLSDGVTPNDDGFELKVNSPAMSAGTTLAAPFDLDILGNTRTHWTLGVYELATVSGIAAGQAESRQALVIVRSGQGEALEGEVLLYGGQGEALEGIAALGAGAAEALQGASIAIAGQAESREGLTLVFAGQGEALVGAVVLLSGQGEALAGAVLAFSGQAEGLTPGGPGLVSGQAEAILGIALIESGQAESIDPATLARLRGAEIAIASHITTELGIRSWIKGA